MAPPKQQSLTSFFGASGQKRISKNRGGSLSSSKRPRQVNGSHFGDCPLCATSFPLHQLEIHASTCTGEPPVCSKNKAEAARIQHVSEPIPGLYIYENFISEEEEEQILAELDGTNPTYLSEFLPWKLGNFNGQHLGKRWGVHCNLRDRRVDAPENPLPHFMQDLLLPRLKQVAPLSGCVPNEGNAIDYRRKAGHHLASHVDDRKLSREPIANLSLAGSCYMVYRNVAPDKNTAVKEMRVLLKPRCLQVLTKKARYEFSHGIEHQDLLSDRRVSITMRESPLSQPLPSVDFRLQPAPASFLRVPRSIENLIVPTAQPIPGLFLFEEFITLEEEARILQQLDSSSDQSWKTERHTGAHREKRFGVDHDLWSKELREPVYQLPSFVLEILQPKLKRIASMGLCVPNDVNSIEYRKRDGHSLKAHVDDRKKHQEPIANLSLAGDCFMTYKNVASNRNAAVQEKRVLLKRRCLQVLTGKARYEFSHGISNQDLPVEGRRVSVTMRETV